MPPVGHRVGLVDDQQPEPAGQLVQDASPETRVGQPLRRDQENVELIGPKGGLHPGPGIDVGGVQCCRAEPGPTCRNHLVTHQ